MKTMDEVVERVISGYLLAASEAGESYELVEGSVSPNTQQTVLRIPNGVYKQVVVELLQGAALTFTIETVFSPANVLQQMMLQPGQQFSMPAMSYAVLLKVRNSSWQTEGLYQVKLLA